MLETDRQDIVRSPKRKGKHALNAPKMPQLPHRPPPQLWSLLHDHTLLLWNILFSPVVIYEQTFQLLNYSFYHNLF